MPIIIEARYAKRIALPGDYSSHEYAVTVRTEGADTETVNFESARLYQILQEAVDREIQTTGYAPGGPRAARTAMATGLLVMPQIPVVTGGCVVDVNGN